MSRFRDLFGLEPSKRKASPKNILVFGPDLCLCPEIFWKSSPFLNIGVKRVSYADSPFSSSAVCSVHSIQQGSTSLESSGNRRPSLKEMLLVAGGRALVETNSYIVLQISPCQSWSPSRQGIEQYTRELQNIQPRVASCLQLSPKYLRESILCILE